jgi:hypothetical protein
MLGKTSTIQSNLGRTWDEKLIIEVGAAAAAAGSTPKVLTFINMDDRLTYKELGRAEVDFFEDYEQGRDGSREICCLRGKLADCVATGSEAKKAGITKREKIGVNKSAIAAGAGIALVAGTPAKRSRFLLTRSKFASSANISRVR